MSLKSTIAILSILFLSSISSGQSCEVNGFFFSTFQDVKTVLDDNGCAACHSNTVQEGDWSYDTYKNMMTTGTCGKSPIVHGNASLSYAYTILTGSEEICGESADYHKIPSTDLDKIETWINQGATEYCLPLYDDVRIVLNENNCNSCHFSGSNEWDYSSFQSIFLHVNSCDYTKPVVVPHDATTSLLYDKINADGTIACGSEMLKSGQPMTARDVALVRDWINGGALQNSAVLPVELSKFEVEEREMTALLEWRTEIEIATEVFVIERSGTGLDFVAVDEVLASGSSAGSSYTYIDRDPILGENYYRLRIIDIDGSYDFSNIRRLRLEPEKAQMIIAPNPAHKSDRLRVIWHPTLEQELAYLNIVDVNGRTLHSKVIFEGTNYVRLPDLLEGVYYVIVEDYFEGILLERVVIID